MIRSSRSMTSRIELLVSEAYEATSDSSRCISKICDSSMNLPLGRCPALGGFLTKQAYREGPTRGQKKGPRHYQLAGASKKPILKGPINGLRVPSQ